MVVFVLQKHFASLLRKNHLFSQLLNLSYSLFAAESQKLDGSFSISVVSQDQNG